MFDVDFISTICENLKSGTESLSSVIAETKISFACGIMLHDLTTKANNFYDTIRPVNYTSSGNVYADIHDILLNYDIVYNANIFYNGHLLILSEAFIYTITGQYVNEMDEGIDETGTDFFYEQLSDYMLFQKFLQEMYKAGYFERDSFVGVSVWDILKVDYHTEIYLHDGRNKILTSCHNYIQGGIKKELNLMLNRINRIKLRKIIDENIMRGTDYSEYSACEIFSQDRNKDLYDRKLYDYFWNERQIFLSKQEVDDIDRMKAKDKDKAKARKSLLYKKFHKRIYDAYCNAPPLDKK